MIGTCKAFLLSRLSEWGIPERGEWSFLFNNNYHPHRSNINILWFRAGDDDYPRLVTKVFRESQRPRAEFDRLSAIYAGSPAQVPRPLYCGPVRESSTLWMEGVPGLPFRPARPHYGKLASLVDAIADVHQRVRRPSDHAAANRYSRMIAAPLMSVGEFGSAAAVRDGCTAVLRDTSPEWLQRLPVIPQHGDLFVSNVLMHRDSWYFVDWETFGLVDLPLYDLVILIVSILRPQGINPGEWDPDLKLRIPGLLDRYSQKTEIASSDLTVLLQLSLANWFYLLSADGRMEAATGVYGLIRSYYENRDAWERVFLRAVE